MLTKTTQIFGAIKGLVSSMIPIAFGLAVLFFFWGIAKFIFASGSGKDEGKKIMVWGVIAIFVMSSIWGIVAFIGDTFGLERESNVEIPSIGGGSSGGDGGGDSGPDWNYW